MFLKYEFPQNEEQSTEFKVLVDSTEVECHKARVSAYPFNQVWPGYQRPIEQTELTSFVTFGADSEITVTIKSEYNANTAKVRPLSKKIQATVIDESTCSVKLPGAGQYVVEFGSRHQVLHIFVNPIKDFSDMIDENTICFEKGVHYLEKPLFLQDNQSVYIGKDAIVYGSIQASEVRNIRVFGYGILDNSLMQRTEGIPIKVFRCENASVEGITIRDSSEWSVHFSGSKNCVVDNIKLIGMWRYNSDGCDFTNSINCILKNSFLRNFDDCIVVKGLFDNPDKDLRNIYVENCITWCDWGKNIEIGAETCADFMENMRFYNCDCIYLTGPAMDVQHGDRALVSNILFENIRVEYEQEYLKTQIQNSPEDTYAGETTNNIPKFAIITTVHTIWSTEATTGVLDNVRFKDIYALEANGRVPGFIIGEIENKGEVKEVYMENICVDGKKLESIEEADVKTVSGCPASKYVVSFK